MTAKKRCNGPGMRFVPIKTEEQLDLQALHRVRERWVMRRTAVVNQIRSLLLERGLTLPKGRSHLDEQLPRILEDAELNLSGTVPCSAGSARSWNWSNSRHALGRWIRSSGKQPERNEACQRLTEIPGVGPVTATALIAARLATRERLPERTKAVGLVGIVPGEYSTSGKQKVLGIDKPGQ